MSVEAHYAVSYAAIDAHGRCDSTWTDSGRRFPDLPSAVAWWTSKPRDFQIVYYHLVPVSDRGFVDVDDEDDDPIVIARQPAAIAPGVP